MTWRIDCSWTDLHNIQISGLATKINMHIYNLYTLIWSSGLLKDDIYIARWVTACLTALLGDYKELCMIKRGITLQQQSWRPDDWKNRQTGNNNCTVSAKIKTKMKLAHPALNQTKYQNFSISKDHCNTSVLNENMNIWSRWQDFFQFYTITI